MPSMDWENCFAHIHELLGALNEADRIFMTTRSPGLFQQLMEADGITGLEQERLDHLMRFICESINNSPLPAAPEEYAPAPNTAARPERLNDGKTPPPNVTKLIVNGVYSSNIPPDNLVQDLETISVLDGENEAKIRKWTTLRHISIAVACCSICLCCDKGVFMYIAFAILAGGIGFAVWAHYFKLKTFVYEFPDYRYLTCLQLAKLLGADMAHHASLETILSLKPNPSPASPPSNDEATTPSGDQSGRRGDATWLKRNTVECWLQLKGQLLDGTKFNFSISEASQAYGEHFSYRSISGKTKTKLKAQKRLQWSISLRLRFKEKRYFGGAMELERLSQLIQLPNGAKIKKLDLKDNEFRITTVTPPKKMRVKEKGSTNITRAWEKMSPSDTEWESLSKFSAMTFLSLYQALNGLRKG